MFKIKIAGLTVAINNRYKYVRFLCGDYITETGIPDFTVSASEEEVAQQQHADGEGVGAPGYCEALCIYRNICLKMIEHGGFLVHGAAISVDGQTYLFLAKSGVGKTTHIRSWLKTFGDRARVVNGDKPILRKFDDNWFVCGTPWCGKEDLGCNRIEPLKALCFLERGADNMISSVPAEQITGRLFHQLLMPESAEQMDVFFALLDDLLAKIPCYLLACNQNVEAAQIAYEGMK